MFWLRIIGYGLVILIFFGGIYEIDVNDDYIVDIGYIVVFERSLDFCIDKVNLSWLGVFFGGEGFVCCF